MRFVGIKRSKIAYQLAGSGWMFSSQPFLCVNARCWDPQTGCIKFTTAPEYVQANRYYTYARPPLAAALGGSQRRTNVTGDAMLTTSFIHLQEASCRRFALLILPLFLAQVGDSSIDRDQYSCCSFNAKLRKKLCRWDGLPHWNGYKTADPPS